MNKMPISERENPKNLRLKDSHQPMCTLVQTHTMKERKDTDVVFSYSQIHKEIWTGFLY